LSASSAAAAGKNDLAAELQNQIEGIEQMTLVEVGEFRINAEQIVAFTSAGGGTVVYLVGGKELKLPIPASEFEKRVRAARP
jgi:hypothetical protein